MRDPDHRFYAENEAPPLGRVILTGLLGFFTFPFFAIACVHLIGWNATAFRLAGLLWAIPMAVYGPRLIRSSKRSGVSLDAYGVTEHYSFSTGRRVAWGEIEDLHVSFDNAWIDTAQGRVELGPPLTDWSDLAHRIGAKLGHTPHAHVQEDADVDVPSGLVASWLGVDETRARSLRSPFVALSWLWQALVLAWGLWHIGDRTHFFWMFRPLTSLAILSLTWIELYAGARRDRRIRRVLATPDALEVERPDGRARYPWGSLRQLARRGPYWVISTSHGDVWLPPLLRGERHLLAAVRNAIEARKEGKVLPRMGGAVPDGAISRVSGETREGRAISLAAAPADDPDA